MKNGYELEHHGVVGMKWGVRRSPAQLGHKPKSKSSISDFFKKKKKTKSETNAVRKPTRKRLKDMSDDEIKDRISRLELEKKYIELYSGNQSKTVSKGKAFVGSVLEKSAKNIAEQAVTYAIGTAVNAALKDVYKDDKIVNPKKGQKDK